MSDVNELFRCEKFRCTLSFKACLERQLQRKRAARGGNLSGRFDFCSSGECEQGWSVRMKFPSYRTKKRAVCSWGMTTTRQVPR